MLIRDFWDCVCGCSTIIRTNGIETVCHQKNPSNDVKYITHMQSVLAKKMEMYTKWKKEETCNNNMVSSKNETVVLRMIYKNKKHIKMFQRLQPPVLELAVL